ncbi:MAG: hypothetical protein QM757_26720 [Paludibaculum sp.]
MFTFETRIARARISVPFDGPVMAKVGDAIVRTVKLRISQALDVNDNPAPPLRPGVRRKTPMISSSTATVFRSYYPQAKQRRNIPPLRNWRFTGKLLNSMQVLSAGPGRVVVGFVERSYNLNKGRAATTTQVAAINQNRWPQFGVSPNDRKAVDIVLLAEVQPVVEVLEVS